MAFLQLSRPTLLKLATALENGRLSPPFLVSTIANYVPASLSQTLVDELNRLTGEGVKCSHIAYTLRLLAAERSTSQQIRDRIELVWTGPEVTASQSRDTSVVVRELFSNAKKTVLISSFAIDKGEKAKKLFQVLAELMDANPELYVQMFLNIQRPHHSEVSESVLLREFAHTFRRDIWVGERLPEVYYDVRSLAVDIKQKSSLHAKCIVVDEEFVLITSANFTEAAHERNIEAGVLLTDSATAQALRSQFDTLVSHKILRPIPGI
ncbi:phospholipase [Trichormus variabilis ARAD]|uniref:Phospholipase n=1 Tax=Trichormus variabilis N2B TaxID=2681315 RepID=A0ABR6S5N3_ANAVA|nr:MULTISPECIES: DISARM system phospholipase D-like protein DrmC [Nostocaceae]MBC1214192.1 phospholipase [Trichormus variabilis ARAD]MBC1254829.1 phospholipase [Trichormus variabilis V5]MBC1265629.1 phospholipase [Trichormus variabilis FSR]MBC1301700.1 phospholipase [Trichormus variabilis N2B]MBC1309929.1 phospholipase [Trichormus variabilis PNB]